ncbi:HEAT repeat domain-containing protein [Actinomadura sp. 3N508]|uniref:HEAT repeat domain-containing protein n=1 Tax=Actinomadura sp. 3N508 TaxID=3375153 RepID=UPI0037A357C1
MPRIDSAGLTHRQLVEKIVNDPGVQRLAERAVADNPRVVEAQRLYAEAARGVLADIAPLVPDLQEIGHRMVRVGDLYQVAVFSLDAEGNELSRRPIDYRAAVPAMLEWLPKITYYPLADDIVRALSEGFAKKQARPVLLRLFRDPPPVGDPQFPEADAQRREDLRVTIGQGLAKFADPSVADEYIELATNRSYGRARCLIVDPGLAKTKDERVPGILLDLLDDPEVAADAVKALGKLRHVPARARISQALASPDENVRDQAKKALERIGDR